MRRPRPNRLWGALLGLAMLLATPILERPAEGLSPEDASPAASATLGVRGYWLVASDGGIFSFGDARFFGSTGNIRLAKPIVGMAATPGGQGYWLVASDGGIFSFGDARFFGSTGNIRLAKPIVGMAATPGGQGYWLVASDGGIFSFGDARFFGSTGNIRLAKPIVGMAATPTGRGYWLVADDGGVFTFGDAAFLGSAAKADQTFVAMTATPTGKGYRLASREGRTFSFGDASVLGSVDQLSQPIVGMAGTPAGDGSWLVAGDGGIFALGSARFMGSTGGMRLNQPIVTGAAAVGRIAPASGGPPPAPPSAPGPAPAPPNPSTPPFTIGLLGDTGYSSGQDQALIDIRDAMAKLPLAFVVHDGDIQKQGTPCTDERLRYVRDVFDGFASPFIFTPGDNEWFDCADRAGRLDAVRRVFFPTDDSLGKTRIRLQRQHPTYVENARWTHGGVYFATINLPGSSGGFVATSTNLEWLNGTFDAAEAANSPAVMIIWQDNPFEGGTNETLRDALKRRAQAFGRPVVLVHGDTHEQRLDKPWTDVPNFTRVETYHGSSGTWVQASVDPRSAAEVFSFKVIS